MKTNAQLMSAQEAIASSLTADDIRIEWEADSPSVSIENRTIYLPRLPLHLSMKDIQKIEGNVDHESAHILYTDPVALKALQYWDQDGESSRRNDRYTQLLRQADFDPGATAFLKETINAIEDGRINAKLGSIYAGVRLNIQRSREIVLSQHDLYHKGPALSRALIVLLLMAEGEDQEAAIAQMGDGPEIRKLLDLVADDITDIADLQSTYEVFEMSIRVAKKWSERDHEGRERYDDIEQESQSNKGMKGTNQEKEPTNEQKKTGANEKMKEAADYYRENLDVAKSIWEDLDYDTSGSDPRSYKADTSQDRVIRVLFSPKHEQKYQEMRKAVQSQIGALRQRLLADLQSIGKLWDDRRRDGMIDDRLLPSVMFRNPNIFRRRKRLPKKNTAISLLVDYSESMSGAKINMAMQTAIAFGETLDVLHFPFWIGGYTTDQPRPALVDSSRSLSLRHYAIKDWGESWKRRKAAVAAAIDVGRDCNVDGESILWAANRLADRPEERKILIVLSDGNPNTGRDERDMLGAHLEHVIETISEKTVIEVLGIGIMTNAVEKFYPNHAIVYNISDLTTTFYERFSALLRGRSPKI